MTPLIVVPVPCDSPEVWSLFRPSIQRFADTLRLYKPGCDYGLIAVVNNSEVTNELHEIFDNLPVTFMRYDGQGADLGSWQAAARANPEAFLFLCTSRVYFHREGWLQRIMEAREVYGPGLYATSASYEGGVLHACIRAVGVDAEVFNAYPAEFTSRDQGCWFEIGRDNPLGPFSAWVRSRWKYVKVVYWSGAVGRKDWLTPDNIFRRGDQSNLLVFDKHSLEYENASPEDKSRFEWLTFGELRP
jgi:hypothetical protein